MMLTNQILNHSSDVPAVSNNLVFEEIISTYELPEIEDFNHNPPQETQEIISENFLIRLGLTDKDKNNEMAICRLFEGDK